MNINFNGYQTGQDVNIGQLNGEYVKEIKESSQLEDSQTIKSILSELKPGDVFEGQITDIRNMNITLLLNGGQELEASMKQAMSFNIGEKLSFQVKSMDDNQIVIKPVAIGNISDTLVKSAILSAGITDNPKNNAIVKELIANGQPIDKSSINNMMKIVNQFNGEDIDKLINMNKHGIEINTNNLNQYDKYENNEHLLNNEINKLSIEINELLSQNENIQDVNEKISFIDKLASILENTSEFTDASLKNSNVIEDNNVNKKINVGYDSSKTETKDNEAETKVNILENDKTTVNLKENDLLNSDINDNQNKMQTSILKEFVQKLETADMKDLSKIINEMQKSGIPEDKIIDLVKSDDIKKVIERTMKKNLTFSIKTETVEQEINKENIKKFYDKLDSAMDFIKNAFDKSPKQFQSLYQTASNIKNNLLFMNDLNNMASYVQIPMQMSKSKTTGELFVYTKGKNKRNINSDTLTAFLHLDMENLGATDVDVKLCKSNLKIMFTLDNHDSQRLVEEHISELSKRLEEKGYKVNVDVVESKKDSFTNIQTGKNTLKKVLDNDSESIDIKRYKFDIRT